MHDIMILLHKMFIDLETFDESQFNIFDDKDKEGLLKEWKKTGKCVRDFLRILSPQQREIVAEWIVSRTRYDRKELRTALKTFTKYLKKKSTYKEYPFPQTSKK